MVQEQRVSLAVLDGDTAVVEVECTNCWERWAGSLCRTFFLFSFFKLLEDKSVPQGLIHQLDGVFPDPALISKENVNV